MSAGVLKKYELELKRPGPGWSGAAPDGMKRVKVAMQYMVIRLVVVMTVPDQPDADGLPERCQLSGDHAG